MPYYLEYLDEDCPNCGGQIWTTADPKVDGECINCKARFSYYNGD